MSFELFGFDFVCHINTTVKHSSFESKGGMLFQKSAVESDFLFNFHLFLIFIFLFSFCHSQACIKLNRRTTSRAPKFTLSEWNTGSTGLKEVLGEIS